MTFEQFIGFILIVLMMGLAFLATWFAGSANYKGGGLWYITIRALFWKDRDCQLWVRENYIYHLCVALTICLCVTVLGLIPPFREGNVYIRPILVLATSPIMWGIIAACYYWFIKKLKHCN